MKRNIKILEQLLSNFQSNFEHRLNNLKHLVDSLAPKIFLTAGVDLSCKNQKNYSFLIRWKGKCGSCIVDLSEDMATILILSQGMP